MPCESCDILNGVDEVQSGGTLVVYQVTKDIFAIFLGEGAPHLLEVLPEVLYVVDFGSAVSRQKGSQTPVTG